MHFRKAQPGHNDESPRSVRAKAVLPLPCYVTWVGAPDLSEFLSLGLLGQRSTLGAQKLKSSQEDALKSKRRPQMGRRFRIGATDTAGRALALQGADPGSMPSLPRSTARP